MYNLKINEKTSSQLDQLKAIRKSNHDPVFTKVGMVSQAVEALLNRELRENKKEV